MLDRIGTKASMLATIANTWAMDRSPLPWIVNGTASPFLDPLGGNTGKFEL